jgi:hypothetical protein
MRNVFQYVKMTILQSCKHLPMNSYVGILFFNDVVTVLTPVLLNMALESSLHMIESALSVLAASKSTNMYEALVAGYNLLPGISPDEKNDNGEVIASGIAVRNSVILITDGEATSGICDPKRIISCANELRTLKRANTFCVAIGSECDVFLLRAISKPGAVFEVASSTRAVIRGVSELIGEMAHVVISKCELAVCGNIFPYGGAISQGYDRKHEGDWHVQQIDRIGADQTKHFVFRVLSINTSLVRIELRSLENDSIIEFLDLPLGVQCMGVCDALVQSQLKRAQLADIIDASREDANKERAMQLLSKFTQENEQCEPELTDRAIMAMRSIADKHTTDLLSQELLSQDYVGYGTTDDNLGDDDIPMRPMFQTKLSRATSDTIAQSVCVNMKAALQPTRCLPQDARVLANVSASATVVPTRCLPQDARGLANVNTYADATVHREADDDELSALPPNPVLRRS